MIQGIDVEAQAATPGALVVDSLPFSLAGTPGIARALAAEGVACMVGYLGAINEARVAALLDAGLAFMPVTYGMAPQHYSGSATVDQCQRLGIPAGTSVWLDMEGLPAWNTDPATLMGEIDAWSVTVSGAGFMPCLYVGVPQPLTSSQLYLVGPVRYWHGQGTITDRAGHPAAPACGWTMRQKWPSLRRGGILVDDSLLQADLLGRVPYWVSRRILPVINPPDSSDEETEPSYPLDQLGSDAPPPEAA